MAEEENKNEDYSSLKPEREKEESNSKSVNSSRLLYLKDNKDSHLEKEESSSKLKEEVVKLLNGIRIKRSFSFDPVAVSSHFMGMKIFLEIVFDDPDYEGEVKKLCSKLGATVQKKLVYNKNSKLDRTDIVVWRGGSHRTIECAKEAGIPVVKDDWVFECTRKDRKLDITPFLINQYQIQEALRRQELGIKFKPKTKRKSTNASTSSRVSKKIEEAWKAEEAVHSKLKEKIQESLNKRDTGVTIKHMEEQFKLLCQKDDNLKQIVLQADSEDEECSFEKDLKETLHTTKEGESRFGSKQKNNTKKLVKRNSSTMDKVSDEKEKKLVVLPLSCFLSNKQNSSNLTIVYQGEFSRLHNIRSMKTTKGEKINIINSRDFGLYAERIDGLICTENSEPTLALLYALIKPLPVLQESFIGECLKFGCFLNPPPVTADQINLYSFNFKVFEKTAIYIHTSEETKKKEETVSHLYTCRCCVDKFGGVLATKVSTADVLVVLKDDKFKGSETQKECKAMYVRIVTVQWLIDSIFKKSKQCVDYYQVE